MTEQLESNQCLNAGKALFEKCNEDFINALHEIDTYKSDKDKIPLICCNFFNVKKCFWDNGKKVSKCNDKRIITSEKFLDALSGNIVDVLCTEYDEGSDRCDKMIAKTPPKPENVTSAKAFFVPILKIWSDLGNPK